MISEFSSMLHEGNYGYQLIAANLKTEIKGMEGNEVAKRSSPGFAIS